MSRIAWASARVWAVRPRATPMPIFSIAALKRSRFSALSMASGVAPIISTPYFARMPCSCSFMAVLSAVCPPRVGNSASGRSRSMTRATISQVIGSMYVRSAISGSVMIVAGLELTRTTI